MTDSFSHPNHSSVIDFNGSDVIQVKANLEPSVMPVLVHQQKIAEAPVFVIIGVCRRVILLEKLRSIVELPQVQAFGYLHNLIYAIAVRGKSPELGPPVIYQEYLLPPVLLINGRPLSTDEDRGRHRQPGKALRRHAAQCRILGH